MRNYLKIIYWFCLLLFSMVPLFVEGQTLSVPFILGYPSSQPVVTFGVDQNGTLSEVGPFNSSATLSLTSGTQMLWIPALSAFRAGTFSGSNWTPANIGQYSVAMGSQALASQTGSIALGYYVSATGASSIALGLISTASSTSTVSIGSFTSATVGNSVAIGTDDLASNAGAVAIGFYDTANGTSSTALGGYTTAAGSYATTMGAYTAAGGSFSTAAGLYTRAPAYDSFVVGTYNTGAPESGTVSSSSWQSPDPLFEIGMGTSTSAEKDALIVYKDGNAVLQGSLKVTPSGDIPMYTGN